MIRAGPLIQLGANDYVQPLEADLLRLEDRHRPRGNCEDTVRIGCCLLNQFVAPISLYGVQRETLSYCRWYLLHGGFVGSVEYHHDARALGIKVRTGRVVEVHHDHAGCLSWARSREGKLLLNKVRGAETEERATLANAQ